MLEDALERDLDEKRALGIFSFDVFPRRLFFSLSPLLLGLLRVFSGSLLPFDPSSSSLVTGDVVMVVGSYASFSSPAAPVGWNSDRVECEDTDEDVVVVLVLVLVLALDEELLLLLLLLLLPAEP